MKNKKETKESQKTERKNDLAGFVRLSKSDEYVLINLVNNVSKGRTLIIKVDELKQIKEGIKDFGFANVLPEKEEKEETKEKKELESFL